MITRIARALLKSGGHDEALECFRRVGDVKIDSRLFQITDIDYAGLRHSSVQRCNDRHRLMGGHLGLRNRDRIDTPCVFLGGDDNYDHWFTGI